MPTDTNNRGWKKVYMIPMDQMEKIPYSIKTPDGNIHIDYPAGSPPLCIQKFVNHSLFNHSKVRNISGEKGLMVGGGKRYDKTSATVIDYVPAINNNSTTSGQTNSLLYEASLAFDNICCNSSVSHSYRNEIKLLSKMNNVTTMKCTKVSSTDNHSTKITVHPTYSITRNLTNALHYDINDDSRSYAIWYTTSDNKRRKSWLLFPDYGIAIEIGKYILISWDGRVMKHCTCSCDENVEDTPIYSFFASSNKLVSFYYKIETAFKKKGHNKGLCKGNKVYVRERLRNMKHQFQYTDPNATKHPNKFMYRSAHIISINVSRKSVFISFLGAIKGDYEVQLYNICNATFLKSNFCRY